MTIFIVEIFDTFTHNREYAVAASRGAAMRFLDRAAVEYADDDSVNRTWFDDNENVWASIIESEVLE